MDFDALPVMNLHTPQMLRILTNDLIFFGKFLELMCLHVKLENFGTFPLGAKIAYTY